MGRTVKRVPIGFDWPMYYIWWGYQLDSVPCQTCKSTGKTSQPIILGSSGKYDTRHTFETEICPTCHGEGKAYPKVDLPGGPGYQLWEITSEGSPISPVFATAEELAIWIVDNESALFIEHSMPYEDWLHYVIVNSEPGHD